MGIFYFVCLNIVDWGVNIGKSIEFLNINNIGDRDEVKNKMVGLIFLYFIWS